MHGKGAQCLFVLGEIDCIGLYIHINHWIVYMLYRYSVFLQRITEEIIFISIVLYIFIKLHSRKAVAVDEEIKCAEIGIWMGITPLHRGAPFIGCFVKPAQGNSG